jgi:hypothetical protein
MSKKIVWVESKPFTLTAGSNNFHSARITRDVIFGLTESDMDPIQTWCEQTGIGKRTSFDTFRFRNQADMSLFLLRWSSNSTK